jgi:cytochrome oxidase Cu insertion factor (SCO1/SenC/PrrC family)
MTRVFAGSPPVRRMVLVVLGVGLLTGMAAAAYMAAPARSASRDASLPNFHLADSTGRAYTIEGFPPESVLVIYFGYTTCLRACPLALDSIAAAMDQLGAQRAAVRPVFIDMDPERAAQASLPLYMQTFGPDFLGLTGSPVAVGQAARAFKVQVERLQFSADPTDYGMTHVSPIFVMRPDDAQPLSLPPTSPPDAIEAALRTALR